MADDALENSDYSLNLSDETLEEGKRQDVEIDEALKAMKKNLIERIKAKSMKSEYSDEYEEEDDGDFMEDRSSEDEGNVLDNELDIADDRAEDLEYAEDHEADNSNNEDEYEGGH